MSNDNPELPDHVKRTIPVYLPDDENSPLRVEGLAEIDEDGKGMQIRFQSSTRAAEILEMLDNRQLLGVTFAYKIPIKKEME